MKSPIFKIDFQPRDLDLIRGLFESRIMTVGHVATLHFDGKKEAAKKRLQKLKAAGLIGERKRQVNEPSVLFLTPKAFGLLRERGILAEYPQLSPAALDKRSRVANSTIDHELEVMDVKAAFHAAIRRTDSFTIAEFSTWPQLHEFRASRNGYGTEVTVKPDGFIRIHEKEADGGLSEHAFFLEVDRSSETQDTLVARAACYLDFYKSGGFALRNGGTREAYKEYPFRVLIVLQNAERRNNTSLRLLQHTPPILTQACLSTYAEVTGHPFDPVWMCPRDYRNTTAGTPFDTERQGTNAGYRRQTAREIFVEANVKKFALLA